MAKNWYDWHTETTEEVEEKIDVNVLLDRELLKQVTK